MMKNALIELKNISLSYKQTWLLQDINLCINTNENILITGPSGSGKTILGKIIAQQLLPTEGTVTVNEKAEPVILVNQQQDFRTAFSQRSYYQNRYEYNNDNDTPTVAKYLSAYFTDHISQIKSLLNKFSLVYILERTLTQLSNGEGKRLQLITALVKEPAVLVLDNPFTGVDKQNRQLLCEIFDSLSEHGVTYILLTKADEIPAGISKIVQLNNGIVMSVINSKDYKPAAEEYNNNTEERIRQLLDKIPAPLQDFDIAVQLNNVTIQYEDKVVLNNITWQVNRGERWLLKGANGSGKSMLLSLLNGDNPKAFGKGIILFDKPKGSGETIWELKSKIGYVSPEMHIHFLRKPEHVTELITKVTSLDDAYQPSITCSEVIASGFNEETGFVSNISTSQHEIVQEWIRFLQIEKYADRAFYQMPVSLQRLSLLARALVQNPPLLILDEPCQGLDEEQTHLFKETVEHFCSKFENTLIYVSHYDIDVPDTMTHLLELEKGTIKFIGEAGFNNFPP